MELAFYFRLLFWKCQVYCSWLQSAMFKLLGQLCIKWCRKWLIRWATKCAHNNPQNGHVPDYYPHPAIVLKMEDGTGILLPIIVLEMPSVLLMAAICNVQIARPTMYQVVQEMVDKMGYKWKCQVYCSWLQSAMFKLLGQLCIKWCRKWLIRWATKCAHNNPQNGHAPDYSPHPAIVLKMEDGTGILLPIIVLEMPSVLLMAAICNVQIARPTMYQVVHEMVDKLGYKLKVNEGNFENLNPRFLPLL